jgi:predicted RNA-binding Zn ribbon-like protein
MATKKAAKKTAKNTTKKTEAITSVKPSASQVNAVRKIKEVIDAFFKTYFDEGLPGRVDIDAHLKAIRRRVPWFLRALINRDCVEIQNHAVSLVGDVLYLVVGSLQR